MRSVTVSAIAGAAILLSLPAARAADMPAPMMYHAPAEDFGGWYLRGDIGMTNQKLKSFSNPLMTDPAMGAPAVHQFLDTGGFDSGWMFGVGIGYQFNSWLRADITGEYRGKTSFHGLDRYDTTGDGTWDASNNYGGTKSEWVALANVYVDLGTWWCVTPFVGAGIGIAYNTFDHYRDVGSNGSVAYAASASKTNFAWALHAGLAYKVSSAFTVELAYRYLSLGDAITGDAIAFDGTNNFNNPTTFNDLTSHDIKLGVRWALEPEPTPMPRPMQLPPLMRKG